MKKRTLWIQTIIAILITIMLSSGVVNAIEIGVSKSIVNIRGEDIHVNVVLDNEFEKIVETEDQYSVNVTTYNKVKNYVVVEEKNKVTGVKSKTVTDLSRIESDLIGPQESGLEMQPKSSIIHYGMSTFFENRYFYWSDMYWGIYNSSGTRKGVYESPYNSTNLISFKDAVDNLINAEVSAISAGGIAVVSAVVAVLTAPTGLGAILGVVVAIGGAIGCVVFIWSMYQHRNSSNFYWSRV